MHVSFTVSLPPFLEMKRSAVLRQVDLQLTVRQLEHYTLMFYRDKIQHSMLMIKQNKISPELNRNYSYINFKLSVVFLRLTFM